MTYDGEVRDYLDMTDLEDQALFVVSAKELVGMFGLDAFLKMVWIDGKPWLRIDRLDYMASQSAANE
jgi:hypothetical protein